MTSRMYRHICRYIYRPVCFVCFSLIFFSPVLALAQKSSQNQSAENLKNVNLENLGEGQTIMQQSTLPEMDIPTFRKRYSPWGLSYFNWATQNLGDTERGTARLTTYNYLSFNYRLNGGMVSFRPQFFINGAGYDEFRRDIVKGDIELGDMYIQYSKYNIVLLPGDIGLTGALRLYLPQGEYAKRQGKITELRGKFYFSKPWGYGWHTTYMLEPRYAFFRERGYLTEFGNSRANRYGQIWHYLEQTKFFSVDYGISAQIGMRHQYYYDFASENIRNRVEDYFENGFYFLFNISGVNFRAGLMQSKNVRRPNGPFEPGGRYKIFNPEESQISVMTSFRL